MRKTDFRGNSIFRDFASPNSEKHYTPSLQLEPKHLEIHLKFNIRDKIIEGYVATTIHANVKGADRILLDAVDMEIQNIDGIDIWHYDGKKISLIWNNPFAADEERIVTIKYKVENPITGLYFSLPDEQYPDRPTYAAIDTESERARYWLPCLDHLSVRCSIDYFITANQDYIILANGKLVAEIPSKEDARMKTAHWQQNFPCPSYLMTIAVGDFIEVVGPTVDSGKGPIPLAYYTSSNFKIEDLARSFADTPKFLKWLVNKFKCPLEWDKYYQIATAMHGGAMENISLVTWGDFAILNEKEAPELQLIIDDVNVHEMSHSWFGDMIVCKEFAHAWLKESWATYVEVLYFEDNLGQDMMQYQLYRDAKSYMEESDSKYARPIVTNHYDSSWDMYDHHLYPGGAWRIHMLRAKLGDEMFFSAVTDYLNTFKGKVVETIDFQRKLEDHSGYNLQEFFDQWLYAPGYPKLKAEFSYDDKTKLSCVKIEQTQEEEKKHIGLFKFPLKIRWETEDEKFEEKIYEITQKDQTLYFRSENKPLQIQIDPDYHLLTSLKFNPGLDMLIHQLKTANTIGKIKSAYTLSEDGSRKALNGLKEAYLSKPFWGVRIEIAKAVAKANHSYAIEILIGFLYHEEDPLVLESLIKTMDSIRDPRIFAAMESYLGRETKFYWATAAALQVIGAQRSMNAFNFLKSYEILDDIKGVVESGRFRAIGKTRLPEAIDYLIEFLPYGKSSDYTRNAVFSALVDSIHWADKSTKDRVLEKLADSIRSEPKESIFYRNLRTLSRLKDPHVISILENCRNRMALQGRPALDRMINAIQKTTTPEEATKKFEKKLDEMKSEMKKLHAKVESLEEIFKLSKN